MSDDGYREFVQHVVALCETNGIEPTDELLADLFAESSAAGFTPEATVAAFDEIVQVDDDHAAIRALFPALEPEHVQDALKDLQTKIGRPLFLEEVETTWDTIQQQWNLNGEFDVDKAFEVAQAKRGTSPDPETGVVPSAKSDWSDPGVLDLHDRRSRQARMAQRIEDMKKLEAMATQAGDEAEEDVEVAAAFDPTDRKSRREAFVRLLEGPGDDSDDSGEWDEDDE